MASPMLQPPDYVQKSEFDQALESIRREISSSAKTHAEFRAEINSKLDQLLQDKQQEAYQAGKREEQMNSINSRLATVESDIKTIKDKQEADTKALRDKQDLPKDKLLDFFVDIIKLIIACGIGYFMHKAV